jgi:creatinine amidohydrolase
MRRERVTYNILELTQYDIELWLKETDVILVPVGSCEAHGPHIPVGADSIEAWVCTIKAAKKADVPHTPLVWMGYSPQHLDPKARRFGTITIRAQTAENLLYDIARSLIYNGFNKIVFVNGHSSNIKILDPVLRRIRYETGAFVCVFRVDSEVTPQLFPDLIEGPPEETPGWHGGEVETSEMLAYDEKLVYLDRAQISKPHAPMFLGKNFKKIDGNPYVIFKNKYSWIYVPMDHSEYSDVGIIGNPFRASKEKGEKIFERVSDVLAEFIEELKKIKITVFNREFISRT